jgi:transcriptional regulator with XRE-family HTH domain
MEKSQSLAPVEDQAPAILSRQNSSSPADLFNRNDVRLNWDNDVKHHVSRHILHLRRFRELSQAKLGDAMGTSQSAVARIEAGEDNITLGTLERIIKALRGRFFISIQPEETRFVRPRPWWERIEQPTSTSDWTVAFLARHRDGNRVVVGMERATTIPSNALNVFTNVSTTAP